MERYTSEAPNWLWIGDKGEATRFYKKESLMKALYMLGGHGFELTETDLRKVEHD